MQPKRNLLKFWKLIQRENAVRYMLLSLFSFVATVSVVRSFLELTGYPQIGSGTLHIAHVLWGGLILYIAAILRLIYLNPRLNSLSAVLSGVGMGLFIDEVGKFITRQYDYFFPAAATIMYVFFLLLLILVIMIRRPKSVDGRAELAQALEIVREQLYRPLEPAERLHLERDMANVINTDPDTLHQDMAKHLLGLIRSDPRTAPETRPAWWMRFANRLEQRLSESRLSWLLVAGFLILGFVTLKNPLLIYLGRIYPTSVLISFLHLHLGGQISVVGASLFFEIRLVLEVLVGLLLLVSAGLLAIGKKSLAVTLGYFSLLVSLAVLDLLLFYYEQFSTVLTVGFQLLVMAGLIYFRRKYSEKSNLPS